MSSTSSRQSQSKTRPSQRSRSAQHSARPQQPKKSDTISVPQDMLGLVIGQLSTIGRYVGQGCRIDFAKNEQGRAAIHNGACTFTIQGWGMSVGRAKVEIQDLLAKQKEKPKTQKKTQTKTKTAQFNLLADSDSDSEAEAEAEAEAEERPWLDAALSPRHAARIHRNAAKQQRKAAASVPGCFQGKDKGGIARLKQEGWERRKAYQATESKWESMTDSEKKPYHSWEDFKRQEMGKQLPTPSQTTKCKSQRVASRAPLETPQLGDGAQKEVSLGAWGQKETLQGVMQEAAVIKPETKTTEPKMETLDKDSEPEPTVETKVVATNLPTGPKKRFKSMNLNAAPGPALKRQESEKPPMQDSWDETDELPNLIINNYNRMAVPNDWDSAEVA